MAIDDVLRNFDKIVNGMEREAEKAVYEVGADLLKESNNLTPIDTGKLRQSGKIKMTKKGDNPTATVSYGDARVDYALEVHEINKNYKEPGTGWKYLETPLKEKSKKYIEYIRKRIGWKP